MPGLWIVWSWDERHELWMEVAQGGKRDMSATLKRKRSAAARLLPSARFAMTAAGDAPSGPPED